MKTVGLFEAKTRLSEICADVVESGEAVVVTRRGRPWVRIDPVEERSASTIRERRAEYLAKEPPGRGRREQEFEPGPRSKSVARDVKFDA